jgi:hypothetical protein
LKVICTLPVPTPACPVAATSIATALPGFTVKVALPERSTVTTAAVHLPPETAPLITLQYVPAGSPVAKVR